MIAPLYSGFQFTTGFTASAAAPGGAYVPGLPPLSFFAGFTATADVAATTGAYAPGLPPLSFYSGFTATADVVGVSGAYVPGIPPLSFYSGYTAGEAQQTDTPEYVGFMRDLGRFMNP